MCFRSYYDWSLLNGDTRTVDDVGAMSTVRKIILTSVTLILIYRSLSLMFICFGPNEHYLPLKHCLFFSKLYFPRVSPVQLHGACSTVMLALVALRVDSSWNVMAHGDASTPHTTSEHGVCSITTADAHNSPASSRLNWPPPGRFKWTRPFRRKTKSGFCACAITFQLTCTVMLTLLVLYVAVIRHCCRPLLQPRVTITFNHCPTNVENMVSSY